MRGGVYVYVYGGCGVWVLGAEANLVVDVVDNVAQLLIPSQLVEVPFLGEIDRLTLATARRAPTTSADST